MNFICKKPIILSGQEFSYGELIPDGFILPERVLMLVRSNYITEVDSNLFESAETVAYGTVPESSIQPQPEETLLTIPISTEKGDLELIMTSDAVIDVLTIMQKTVEEAEKDIMVLESEDALILLNALDARKGIQKAAEERNVQLQNKVTDATEEEVAGDA